MTSKPSTYAGGFLFGPRYSLLKLGTSIGVISRYFGASRMKLDIER